MERSKELQQIAEKELAALKMLLQKIESGKRTPPPGFLTKIKTGSKEALQHVIREDGRETRRVLALERKADRQLAKRLAIKNASRHMRPIVTKNIKALEMFLRTYRPFDPTTFSYLDLTEGTLIPEGYVDIWQWAEDTRTGNYRHNEAYPEYLRFMTKKGDLVRA